MVDRDEMVDRAVPSGAMRDDRKEAPRALVIEPDEVIRRMVATILRRKGYEPHETRRAADAIRLLQNGTYEVIVLDVGAPAGTNSVILEYLRDHMPAAVQRVVITSAAQHVQRYGLPDKVCRFVPKPFDVGEFAKAVEDCTDRS